MSHVALPLKYRPMTFADVVGQEHVVRTLRHAIESGRVANAYLFIGPRGIVTLSEGCIIANRHIHMSLSDGARYGVVDGDYVTVDVAGEKKTRFYDVQVRVSDAFVLEMHVDTDDANAAALGNGSLVSIVKD